MKQDLTLQDIDLGGSSEVYTQSYEAKKLIEGVKIISLKNFVGEDGDLTEVLRISDQGTLESIPDFKLAQVNRTQLLPGMVKGWHLHLNQDDVWHVLPAGHMLIGLWDVRKDSPTHGVINRFALGGGNSQLLYVPRGVAHGCTNVTKKPVEMLYLVNQKFDAQNPDEHRIKWDAKGTDFWSPKRD